MPREITKDEPHKWNWLLERAEEAAMAGLSLKDALEAVRAGYSSVEADRSYALELGVWSGPGEEVFNA